MLKAEDLTVRYGALTVVDHLNFSVEEGQWLMIAGPNGAGKSTVLRAVSQGTAYAGRILFEGEDIRKKKAAERARCLGVLMQTHLAEYSFSVEEVVALGRYAHRGGFLKGRPGSRGEVLRPDRSSGSRGEVLRPDHLSGGRGEVLQSDRSSGGHGEVLQPDRLSGSRGETAGKAHESGCYDRDSRAIDAALALTGLESRRKQSILTLSGGELQRTFLAQVFAQDPKLLLLDEPTNHLDLVYQKQVFGLISEWLKTPGRAVISVVHDLSLAKAYGTRALLMNQGRAVAEGTAEEVFTAENLDPVYQMDVYAWMRGMLGQWEPSKAR